MMKVCEINDEMYNMGNFHEEDNNMFWKEI